MPLAVTWLPLAVTPVPLAATQLLRLVPRLPSPGATPSDKPKAKRMQHARQPAGAQ